MGTCGGEPDANSGKGPLGGELAASDVRTTQEISVANIDAGGDVFVSAIQVVNRATRPDSRDAADALIRGPLKIAGAQDLAQEATQLREDGRHEDSAAIHLQVAEALERSEYALVAEFYIDAAADLFARAGNHERAAELMEDVVRRRLARYDLRAFNDAVKLGRYITEDRSWVADGLAARAVWPEQPEAAVNTLDHAALHARAMGASLEWVSALVEVLMNIGRYDRALEVAAQARTEIPFDFQSLDRERLAIELDFLDAALLVRSESVQAEDEWSALLTGLQNAPPLEARDAAWVWQRRAAFLFQADRFDEGRSALLHAIRAWSAEDGNEDQIREAFYSRERATTLGGSFPIETAHLYAYVFALRGHRTTPATLAERLESSGLHSRLAQKWPDALRSLWLAYGIHREAGNFYGRLDAANLLAELHVAAGQGARALRFWIECGQEKLAVDLAEDVSSEVVSDALMLRGATWQRAVTFAVLGQVGDRLERDMVHSIAGQVMREAKTPLTRGIGPDPALKARAAVAGVLLDMPDADVDEARELVASIIHIPVVDRLAIRALVRLTESGRADETARLADAYLAGRIHARGALTVWLGEQLPSYPELERRFRDAAVAGDGGALHVLAISDSSLRDDELVAVATQRITAFLDDQEARENAAGERVVRMTDLTDLGLIGRLCADDVRRRLIDRLLSTAEDDEGLVMTRASALDGIYNLATVASRPDAEAAVERLLPLARGEYSLSEFENPAGTDPYARFQFSGGPPAAIRVAALGAAAALIDKTGADVSVLVPEIQGAVQSSDPEVMRAGLITLVRFPELPLPVDFQQAGALQPAGVRLAAYNALGARELLAEVELTELARDDHASIRAFALTVAIDKQIATQAIARRLVNDPAAHIRRRAASQLTD